MPAPILSAQVTRGLQEPFGIEEQQLKGSGCSSRGSTWPAKGGDWYVLGLQRNSCSGRVKARPGKVTFSRFEGQATKAVPCLRLHSEAGCTHSLLSGIIGRVS